ncbi:MAG: ADP-ribosylglycohydrolase family protein [Prevotella sp.]|nr:ADP-ribosylglycohydrolase family protein [Prevotella sp.]
MIGAIIGDIVGSRFEFGGPPEKDFKLFTDDCSYTDDTICTVAVADAIMNGKPYRDALLEWCRRYPNPMGGYGPRFLDWIESEKALPNNSCGNGAAMRVSPVGWLFDDYKQVLMEAQRSAEVSHCHSEGIRGAQCIAEVILWLRHMRFKKEELARKVKKFFGYDILPLRDIMRIGSTGHFDSICQETVPWAIRCFINANNFEETIRLAVMCDGDTDTKAAIAGSIAEAYYPVPSHLVEQAVSYLPKDMLDILDQFLEKQKEGLVGG